MMHDIVLSTDIKSKNLKILLRGPYSSRKTETALRYFPHVLILDTEGNADQCVGLEEIPPFLRIETKDVYEILNVLDDVIAGEIKFPDGSEVETVCIDSITVLWSVRQEVGAMLAEKRAVKYARGKDIDPDAVNLAQLDWVKAKRPLKRLHAKFNASGIKYLILTAREKDKFEEKVKEGGRKELVKVGTMMDGMKGLEYEVNIAFRMFNTEPWKCEITKVQGVLGTLFPQGTTYPEFPHKELIKYASKFKVKKGKVAGEVEVAEEQLERELKHTQKNLIAIAKENGIGTKEVAAVLKAAGIKKFDADQWDEMVEAVKNYKPEE